MPPHSHLVITVPGGDVWLFPGREDDDPDWPDDANYQLLFLGNTLRSWTPAEQAALPAAVAREKKVSQSDRRGTTRESVAAAPKEP